MQSKYQLSILIPARNEEFLALTVKNILEQKRGQTEILIGLDGQWADPEIEDHPDVTILYFPESIGQRAMTNQLCRLSEAKYVAKIDAHCCFDEGFDVKLMEDMQDDITIVPVMTNLHGFDWVCPNGHRRYQSPSDPCAECGQAMKKEIIFKPRNRTPHSTSYRFDKTLHFQYFNEYKKIQDQSGSHMVETMSLQGSFFMLTREKYWELNICDEAHGSWGQQGTEVACKTWLSGGRVFCDKRTWYAHLFRTQGRDFGFPYPNPGAAQEKAREYSKQLFLEGKWDKAIRPLSWLVNKFAPVPDWDVPSKSIIYYTDNRLDERIAEACREQIIKANLPITSTSLAPIAFGRNIVLNLQRGIETYFKQIITALENATSDIVFFCEHDVLYPPSHFDFTPPSKDKFYYDHNWIKVRLEDGFAVHWDADQVSGLCCYRELALAHYKKVLENFQKENFDRKYEPGSGVNSESWLGADPCVDIRVSTALTKSKWSLNDFRDKSTAKGFEVVECPAWALDVIMIGRK